MRVSLICIVCQMLAKLCPRKCKSHVGHIRKATLWHYLRYVQNHDIVTYMRITNNEREEMGDPPILILSAETNYK